MFTDDVREFSATDDAATWKGRRKAITLMVKDSKKYASTGGWGSRRGPAAMSQSQSPPTR